MQDAINMSLPPQYRQQAQQAQQAQSQQQQTQALQQPATAMPTMPQMPTPAAVQPPPPITSYAQPAYPSTPPANQMTPPTPAPVMPQAPAAPTQPQGQAQPYNAPTFTPDSSAMAALTASQGGGGMGGTTHPEFDPEKMNELVGEVDGKLIPDLLNLLASDPSSNRDAIERKIQDGFALVSQIEMASDPEDVFHKQAIGELYGKLKLAEAILGRLTSR
jgi:hypothetical protein